MKKKRWDRVELIAILLIMVTLGVTFAAHRAAPIPMTTDDIWYQTKLSSEEPIDSVTDIIESQVWHYFNWGGRSIAHGLLQLVLWAGEYVADIINVLATFVLTTVICIVAKGKKASWFLAAVGMLTGLNANWLMSMYWQAGAANYLYITIFVLGFLYCYVREDVDERLPGISFWIIPLGLLAGWSNENMGPMAWVLSVVAIGLQRFWKKKIHLWMVTGSISGLIGSLLVVLAPGNFVRAKEAGTEYGVLWKLFLRCYGESKAALEYLFPTILMLLLCVFVSKGVLHIAFGKTNWLLLIGAVLSWGAMVLSPHYPDRATFGTMVLLICIILSLLRKIVEVKPDTKWYIFGIVIIIWLRGMFFLGEYLTTLWGWIR